MDRIQTQEMISALADGQLQGDAFARGVEAAAADTAALEAWHTYHLIGDVLRSGEFRAGMLPIEFLGEVRSRLQQEQRVRAPAAAHEEPAVVPRSPLRAAENDATFRWKLVAGAASLTAMAAIAWNVAGAFPGKAPEARLAAGQRGTVLAGQQGGVMIRDPRLDEFLAAHRQLGGASALQMPAGFLRNATFEGVNR